MIFLVLLQQLHSLNPFYFYAPTASACRGHRVFLLFWCAYIRPSEDQVKIFGQSRISRPINGSKLIFHMRLYLYESSRNIQEPWPPDLYFMVHWLRTLARLSRLRFLSKVESQDLLMVASWYFIWGCISVSQVGIYKSHDLLTYISLSADSEFGWFSTVNIFIIGRFLSSTDGSKLIFYLRLYLCEISSVYFHAKCSCSGVGLEVSRPKILFYISKKDEYYTWVLVQCDTNIDLKLCM